MNGSYFAGSFRKDRKSCSCASLIKHLAMKTYGGVDRRVYLYQSSSRHQMKVSGQLHVPAALSPVLIG
jgi:hypothetical protein